MEIVQGTAVVQGIRKTSPYMSQYEYCALVTARAAQLSNRFTSTTPESLKTIPEDKRRGQDYDPLYIAIKDITNKTAKLIVRRKLPDGSTEDWSLQEMILPRI